MLMTSLCVYDIFAKKNKDSILFADSAPFIVTSILESNSLIVKINFQ